MRGRRGFTLFEVLLSLAIAVLLLAAVYATIGYQLQAARAGREVMERSTLSRSLFTRISADIMSASTLSDPARFRRIQNQQAGGMAGGGGATGTMTGSATGSMTGATGSATGGMTGSATGSMTGATGSATGTGTTAEDTATQTAEQEAPIEVPIGIVGDATSLNLFVTKVPGEALPTSTGGGGQITSDLRRIAYWMGSGGLCRLEAKVITSAEALDGALPGDEQNYRIAPEVKSLELSYFDGTDWYDTWDSTAKDEDGDGLTPIGPPRAIRIRMGFLPPPDADGAQPAELKYLTHVVVIPTGGSPAQPDLTNSTANP